MLIHAEGYRFSISKFCGKLFVGSFFREGGPVIEVDQVTKLYGPHAAVKEISFKIQEGEVLGFLGPNGAGKTTTMRMLTGFLIPTHGMIKINGVNIFENPKEAKKHFGYLPESPPLYGDMKVKNYLLYVADLKGVSRDQRSSFVSEAIDRMNLGSVEHRLIQNLSKGFRQRVGIAQALVNQPKILIFDEPTVGLDPAQVAEFRSLIRSLKGSHTVILSTHILQEVQANCERVIIINEGSIIAQNTMEALAELVEKKSTSERGGQVKIMLKVRRPHPDFQRNIRGLSYVHAVENKGQNYGVYCSDGEEFVESLAREVLDHNVGLLEIRREPLELEDIFVKLTQGGVLASPSNQESL